MATIFVQTVTDLADRNIVIDDQALNIYNNYRYRFTFTTKCTSSLQLFQFSNGNSTTAANMTTNVTNGVVTSVSTSGIVQPASGDILKDCLYNSNVGSNKIYSMRTNPLAERDPITNAGTAVTHLQPFYTLNSEFTSSGSYYGKTFLPVVRQSQAAYFLKDVDTSLLEHITPHNNDGTSTTSNDTLFGSSGTLSSLAVMNLLRASLENDATGTALGPQIVAAINALYPNNANAPTRYQSGGESQFYNLVEDGVIQSIQFPVIISGTMARFNGEGTNYRIPIVIEI